MKNIVLGVFTLLSTLTYAQGFQGVATYESKTNVEMDLSGRDITPEMQAMIKERMAKAFEKTFTLTFDQTHSIYREEEQLDAPGQGGPGGGMFRMMGSFTGGDVYKNVREARYTDQRDMFGKMFLIKDSLTTYNWEMTNESRQIGAYTCFKATAVVKVDELDIRSMRQRNRDQNNEENEEEEETEETEEVVDEEDPMSQIEMPEEITVTAWYTPEIPVNQGPGMYWGLPGLILEINADRTTILCSKIILNPTERQEIEEPDNGDVVTQEEYNKIMMERMEEMRERYGRGRGGRGGRRVRIGG